MVGIPNADEHPSRANKSHNKELLSMQSLQNLDELESLATRNLSKKAWSFNYAAAGDSISKGLDQEVYRSILLRPRILVNVKECDLSTTIIGHRVGLPIFVSPMAMARLAHPTGEAGISAACGVFGAMHIISNNASMSPEEIVAGATPDQVFGFQLYIQTDRTESEDVLARINKLPAIKCIVLTVDEPVPGKHELGPKGFEPYNDMQTEILSPPEESSPPSTDVRVAIPSVSGPASDAEWETTLQWLTKHTSLPIIIKGIQTHEDAQIAATYAPRVKGIILSNHGGRVLDTAPPAIHTLLEIRKYCPEVREKLDVMVDGGIRRGTDVVKALCLGARAVGIGRAVFWGLGAGGIAGVERALQSKCFISTPILSSVIVLTFFSF
jgi:isopentenyl diphosphate isomerase/L-lactate dehydrogenase-like FMN-dependent dehydrogenase